MNIDLLPFNAFALESCSAGPDAASQALTLTVPVELAPVLPIAELMAGYASAAPAGEPMLLRAQVLAARRDAITITF